MTNGREPRSVREQVVAYCEGMAIPDINRAVIAQRLLHTRSLALPRALRWRIAGVIAAIVLGAILWRMPIVLADVEQLFRAFDFRGTTMAPMTIRAVDLAQARRDVRFRIVVPPRVAVAPVVTINEIVGNKQRSPDIVFELHGTAAASMLIVETDAAARQAPTLLTTQAADPTPDEQLPKGFAVRGSFAGHRFSPAVWIARGTRIAVMSPPGLLSTVQLRAIREAMLH